MPRKKQIAVATFLSYEVIERKIYHLRGSRVMLDSDLAQLYQVPTKVLIQAVKRNLKRFPDDFMYQLDNAEVKNLISQSVISSWGGRRHLPYAFTEQGVAMLSSVLSSPRAIQVNIEIMRAFVRLKELALSNKELRIRIEELEKKYDQQFQVVFRAIKALLEKDSGPPKRFDA